jgi:hypothetical protein
MCLCAENRHEAHKKWCLHNELWNIQLFCRLCALQYHFNGPWMSYEAKVTQINADFYATFHVICVMQMAANHWAFQSNFFIPTTSSEKNQFSSGQCLLFIF